jgi:hypothetical protein
MQQHYQQQQQQLQQQLPTSPPLMMSAAAGALTPAGMHGQQGMALAQGPCGCHGVMSGGEGSMQQLQPQQPGFWAAQTGPHTHLNH